MSFKEIFLENLEQDRYGLASDNDGHFEDKKVIYNTATSITTANVKGIVPLPNIDILNNEVYDSTTLRSRSTEGQPYTTPASGNSFPRKYWLEYY